MESRHRQSSDPLLERDGHDTVQVPAARLQLADLSVGQSDKVALILIATGIALFLPLTLLLILTSSPTRLGWFAPHAPLNAFAITCFALGIVPLQPPTPGPAQRAARLETHQAILLGLALPAMSLGTAAMFWNKHKNGAQHMTTWHATFGCLCVLLMLGQAALGAASVWDGGRALGGGMKAKSWYKYHRLSGYVLITLALSTAFLGGMYSTWAVKRGPSYVPLRLAAYGLGIPLILAGVSVRMRTSKIKLF